MVDVSAKEISVRSATATGFVRLSASCVEALRSGNVPKGDALAVARIAGIQAAKRTPDLVPLCHPIVLAGADVEVACDENAGLVRIEARVHAVERTGVEMEALTAASVAALTVYDMCKAVDRGMVIEQVKLLHKSGGKSGTFDAR